MNGNAVAVSACIIVFNHERYLRECLESVVNQRVNFCYEVVIGEDRSSDTSLQICREYKTKYPNLVRLIERPKNLGMAKNWVETIMECKGEYIAICEGDDYWVDNYKLQKQYDFISANLDFSACFGRSEVLNLRGHSDNFSYPIPSNSNLYLKDTLNRHYIPTATLFFQKRMLLDIPNFIFSVLSVDIFIETKLIMKGPIRFLNEQLAVYRIHDGGITNTNHAIEFGEIKLTEMYKYFFSHTFNGDRELFRAAIAHRYLNQIHKLRQVPYFQGLFKLLNYIKPIILYFRQWCEFKPLIITITLQIFPFLLKRKNDPNLL